MTLRKQLIAIILLVSVALTACQPVVAPPDEMMEEGSSTMEVMKEETSMEELEQEPVKDGTPKEIEAEQEQETSMKEETPVAEEPVEEMQASEGIAEDETLDMVETPGWFDITLTNVNTEGTFTINDFHGKVVLVETLAMWCSNCRKQQNQVIELHNLLGERDDFVSIGLDIDPNENRAQLKKYTADNGFDWIYAVAPVELGRELANLYGSQFLNPPSTPMLIVDRQGIVHPLPFGIKSAGQLKEALDPFLQESL